MTVALTQIAALAYAFFGAQTETERGRAEHVFVRRYIECHLNDEGTAGNGSAEHIVHRANTAGRVVSMYITAPVTISAHNSNYATFTLSKKTGVGTSTAIAAPATTITAGLTFTAFLPVAITLTAANVGYAAGDSLTLKLVKTASGQACGAARSPCHVTVLVEEGA